MRKLLKTVNSTGYLNLYSENNAHSRARLIPNPHLHAISVDRFISSVDSVGLSLLVGYTVTGGLSLTGCLCLGQSLVGSR